MNKRRHSPLLGLLTLAAMFTPGLSAQMNYPGQPPQRPMPNVMCESRNNRRNYCAADTRGGVTLDRQLSSAQCVQGRTWGFDARGIWVEGGCRGEFRINAYNGTPNWGNPATDTARPVRAGRVGATMREPASTRRSIMRASTSACGAEKAIPIYRRVTTTASHRSN